MADKKDQYTFSCECGRTHTFKPNSDGTKLRHFVDDSKVKKDEEDGDTPDKAKKGKVEPQTLKKGGSNPIIDFVKGAGMFANEDEDDDSEDDSSDYSEESE